MINTIHNPNETLWDGIFPEEDVYQIEKFFDDQEVKFLVDYYYKNIKTEGWHIQGGNLNYIEDFKNKEVSELILPRIEKHFGEFRLYDQIHNDKTPHSADFFIEQKNIFVTMTQSHIYLNG